EGTARPPTLPRGTQRRQSDPPRKGWSAESLPACAQHVGRAAKPRKVRARESPGRAARLKHTPSAGSVNPAARGRPSAERGAGAAQAAEEGERVARNRLPDELPARLDLAVAPRRE